MIARPVSALVEPTVIDRAFDDPQAVLELIERGAPYKTLAAVHRDPRSDSTAPWFRNFWALGEKVVFPGAEQAFHNPRFIEAARSVFNAQVVRPLAMMTNLNVPGPESAPHLDLPFFRGAHAREVPSWILAPMGYSGLFHRWAIPVASALTWIYTGTGGEFEYWADGIEAPSTLYGEMAANHALIADNEYTYHRVCQVGSPDEFLADDAVPYDATLSRSGDGWAIHAAGQAPARFRGDQVRISILWKAFCFADEAEEAAFVDGEDQLDPARVISIFERDLTDRGIDLAGAEAPADLDGASPWAEIISSTYVPAK